MLLLLIGVLLLYYVVDMLLRLPTVGKYDERYVFITGCDTGFGNLLAKRLDSLGFHVFAGCLSERGADELGKVSSVRLMTLSLDVTKKESVDKARMFVERHLPSRTGLWALVNNAGIFGSLGQSDWLTREDYDQCLNVNLFGVINVTKVFQSLVRQGQGRIVNMASIVGRLAVSAVPYSMSKHGVEAFSDLLRREVKKQGMTVHIIEPGAFNTDIVNVDTFAQSYLKAFNQTSPEVQRYYGPSYCTEMNKRMVTSTNFFTSNKPEKVVDAYTHAITAVFPRYRYRVGHDARYLFTVLMLMPEWLSDWIITLPFVTPDGARH